MRIIMRYNRVLNLRNECEAKIYAGVNQIKSTVVSLGMKFAYIGLLLTTSPFFKTSAEIQTLSSAFLREIQRDQLPRRKRGNEAADHKQYIIKAIETLTA